MARSAELEKDPAVFTDDWRDEDVDRIKAVFGQDRAPSLRKDQPMPPNPSEPRRLQNFGIFQKILPQIQANSPTPEDYKENLKRVLIALFKHEHKSEPGPEEMAELEQIIGMEMGRQELKERAQNTHFSEDEYPSEPLPTDHDKLMRGLDHGPPLWNRK